MKAFVYIPAIFALIFSTLSMALPVSSPYTVKKTSDGTGDAFDSSTGYRWSSLVASSLGHKDIDPYTDPTPGFSYAELTGDYSYLLDGKRIATKKEVEHLIFESFGFIDGGRDELRSARHFFDVFGLLAECSVPMICTHRYYFDEEIKKIRTLHVGYDDAGVPYIADSDIDSSYVEMDTKKYGFGDYELDELAPGYRTEIGWFLVDVTEPGLVFPFLIGLSLMIRLRSKYPPSLGI